ncbi:MAG: aminotransferase class I/II-fold pyridoxal phosphate-dependent enzyme [Flavobacteriales bacterium AspAUS03]
MKGYFHHAAVTKHFGKSEYELFEYMKFKALNKTIAQSEIDAGVMAIENSIASNILTNYSLLSKHTLKIIGEVYIPIRHQLMTLPGQSLENLQEMISHLMALLRCEAFFDRYPAMKISEYPDTAGSTQDITDNWIDQLAVIAPKNAVEVYGLQILARDIQTVLNNFTRFFILISSEQRYPEIIFDKTSISFRLLHTTGNLPKVLYIITELGINMTKIQSIHIIKKPWEYAFFIDLIFKQIDIYQEIEARLNKKLKSFQSWENTKMVETYEHQPSITEYYFFQKLKEIGWLKVNSANIINLGIWNPYILPPNSVIQEMQQAADLPHANTYQRYINIDDLRQVFTAWYLKNYQVSLYSDEEILPLMGSKEGIIHISMSYLEHCDQVLVPDLSYPNYTSVSQLIEAEILHYELKEENHWQPDLHALECKDLSQIKILWINYPHIPTGTVAKLEQLKKKCLLRPQAPDPIYPRQPIQLYSQSTSTEHLSDPESQSNRPRIKFLEQELQYG